MEDVLSDAVAGSRETEVCRQGEDPRGVSRETCKGSDCSSDAGRGGMFFAPVLCVVAGFVNESLIP